MTAAREFNADATVPSEALKIPATKSPGEKQIFDNNPRILSIYEKETNLEFHGIFPFVA